LGNKFVAQAFKISSAELPENFQFIKLKKKMEGNDPQLKSNTNSSTVLQPLKDGNSSRLAVLTEAVSRNEVSVSTESDGKSGIDVTGDKGFLKEEKEVCSDLNSTNVNRLNGLASIADSYSVSDGESCGESSVDSFNFRNAECDVKVSDNNVDTCVNPVCGSDKETLWEEQKNDLNSQTLMDTTAHVKQLESEGCLMKPPGNNGCTPVDPVKIEQTLYTLNGGSSDMEQVNEGQTLKECLNGEHGVTEHVNVGHTLEQQDAGHTGTENARCTLVQCGNVLNAPAESDTNHQVYTMSSIDKELESICKNEEGAVQAGKLEEADSSSSDSSSDSDDDSSSSESSTSSDSSSDDDLENIRKEIDREEEPVQTGPMKTRSEVLIRDLPEVPDLNISIDDNVQLVELGLVFSIVGSLVVVKASPQTPALDSDSILFLENRSCLGLVFETFGPVQRPFYSIRFNKESDISDKNVQVGDKVFYAPEMMEYSNYVFVAELKKLKGSDASWEHDEEPPAEVIEYSDDEEEAKARSNRKKGRMAKSGNTADDSNIQEKTETGTVLHQGAKRGNRKRTWQNRAKGQPIKENQGTPLLNPAPLPHPAYRGRAPWHGSTLPPQAPGSPFMGHPTPEVLHFGMSPMGPPIGAPPSRLPHSGLLPRGPLGMMPGPMGQFPVTHPGHKINAPRSSCGPTRPIPEGPGIQGPWPMGPHSGFAPRYPIPAPQGFQDPARNVGFQGRDFMGILPPPPPPPPNL